MLYTIIFLLFYSPPLSNFRPFTLRFISFCTTNFHFLKVMKTTYPFLLTFLIPSYSYYYAFGSIEYKSSHILPWSLSYIHKIIHVQCTSFYTQRNYEVPLYFLPLMITEIQMSPTNINILYRTIMYLTLCKVTFKTKVVLRTMS